MFTDSALGLNGPLHMFVWQFFCIVFNEMINYECNVSFLMLLVVIVLSVYLDFQMINISRTLKCNMLHVLSVNCGFSFKAT